MRRRELRSPPQAKAYATKPCKKPSRASRQAAYEAAAGCEPTPPKNQPRQAVLNRVSAAVRKRYRICTNPLSACGTLAELTVCGPRQKSR
jgi:hypothetical protein